MLLLNVCIKRHIDDAYLVFPTLFIYRVLVWQNGEEWPEAVPSCRPLCTLGSVHVQSRP